MGFDVVLFRGVGFEGLEQVEVVERLMALMRGELRGPDGELVDGQEAVQTPLAILYMTQ